MNASDVRSWLMRQPRPVKVRLTDGEGNHSELECQKAPWIATAESICALDPVLLEAFDEAGALTRAVRPGEGLETSAAPRVSRAPLDGLPPGTQVDAETQRSIVVANLIARAYEHSTDVAFENLVALFEASNQRTASLERTVDAMNKFIQRAAAAQAAAEADAAAAEAEASTDPLNAFVSAVAQGAAAHAADKPNGAPAPTNGKAKA